MGEGGGSAGLGSAGWCEELAPRGLPRGCMADSHVLLGLFVHVVHSDDALSTMRGGSLPLSAGG